MRIESVHERGPQGRFHIVSEGQMTCDATTFFVEDTVEVFEGDEGDEREGVLQDVAPRGSRETWRRRASETRGGRMYIGAHVNSSGGVWKAIGNGVDIGCEAIQIFAGSPRTWAPTIYKDKDAERFREPPATTRRSASSSSTRST